MIFHSIYAINGMHSEYYRSKISKLIGSVSFVTVPEVIIADEHGTLLVDKYYEVDSTIQLVCIVRHIAMTSSVVYWLHGEKMLNFDTTRGGIRYVEFFMIIGFGGESGPTFITFERNGPLTLYFPKQLS